MNRHTFVFAILVALVMGPIAGRVGADGVITPTGATSTTTVGGAQTIATTIDGSLLSSGGTSGDILSETVGPAASAGHWLSASTAVDDAPNYKSTTEVLTFDLGGSSYDVNAVHIWPYIRSERIRGVKTFDISFSFDGGSTYPTTIPATTLGNFTMGPSTGSEPVQSKTFAMQYGVTHIRFTNITTFGSADYIAISELRFSGPINNFAGTIADNVSYNTARLKTTLSAPETNANVSVHWWKTGDTATNSATVGAWTNEASTNLTYAIPSGPGLSPGTRYNFAFRATNETADVWSPIATFITIFQGELLAEYVFDGSVASTDSHTGTTAGDITIAAPGSAAVSYATYLQFSGLGASYPGGDNFSFTLNTGSARISLTGIMWDWGVTNGWGLKSGFFSGTYQGFGTGAEIPGTYTNSTDATTTIAIKGYAADLSALPGFQNLLATNVVFRVSLSDAATTTTRYYSYDNIRVYGTVEVSGGTLFLIQ